MADVANLSQEARITMTTPCEGWTPAQKGRALEMIRVLANTHPSEWRGRQAIYEALAEFRDVEHGENAMGGKE
jgi:hypothetical protein